jgi:hypothetical protein
VESTFSAIRRKFGADVVSKNPTTMVIEVLRKIICPQPNVFDSGARNAWHRPGFLEGSGK